MNLSRGENAITIGSLTTLINDSSQLNLFRDPLAWYIEKWGSSLLRSVAHLLDTLGSLELEYQTNPYLSYLRYFESFLILLSMIWSWHEWPFACGCMLNLCGLIRPHKFNLHLHVVPQYWSEKLLVLSTPTSRALSLWGSAAPCGNPITHFLAHWEEPIFILWLWKAKGSNEPNDIGGMYQRINSSWLEKWWPNGNYNMVPKLYMIKMDFLLLCFFFC